MELSVREARARFAAALAAAEGGERVIITKNGEPVAELGPPSARPKNTFTWKRVDRIRGELGLDKLPPDDRTDDEWFADFNDPIFTQMMLGDQDDDRASDDS